jgi:hypothetical protein
MVSVRARIKASVEYAFCLGLGLVLGLEVSMISDGVRFMVRVRVMARGCFRFMCNVRVFLGLGSVVGLGIEIE